MTYEIRDGQGSLFTNSFKKQDNHPDLKGTIRIAGVVYELAGWNKCSAKGTKFLSLSARPKDDSREASYRTPAPKHIEPEEPQREELDDTLPF